MLRSFLVIGHTAREESVKALVQVVQMLCARNVQPVLLTWQVDELLTAPLEWLEGFDLSVFSSDKVSVVQEITPELNLELAVVLGGDGTILRAIETVRGTNTPVHGVNLGHVGFLAESEPEELINTVERLIEKQYRVEERTTLHVDVHNEQGELVQGGWALNEFSLEKANRQKMLNVNIAIDHNPISKFGCDGVLISSPTGSTAYAFSAGGPVIWPEVEAMLLVPLAAHALFARPLVLGPSSQIEVTISNDAPVKAIISCDGRRSISLRQGWRITVRKSSESVRLIRLTEVPFSHRLVSKFQLDVEGWRD